MELANYKTNELKSVVDLDAYAVRDEAYARSAKLAKKIARIQKQLADAIAENEECGRAIKAAYEAIGRE